MIEVIKNIADFLKTLSDPKRLEIIIYLKDGEKTSKDIETALKLRQPNVSQQLKTLQDVNLIKYEKRDNKKYYSIRDPYLFKILSNIQSFLINLEKEKIRDYSDMNIFDTLI